MTNRLSNKLCLVIDNPVSYHFIVKTYILCICLNNNLISIVFKENSHLDNAVLNSLCNIKEHFTTDFVYPNCTIIYIRLHNFDLGNPTD